MILKQIFDNDFKAYFFSKYVLMYYQEGLKAIEKDLKKQKWIISSFNTNGTPINITKIIPKVMINSSNGTFSLKISFHPCKIPLKGFTKEYPIDYLQVLADERIFSSITLDGEALVGMNTLNIQSSFEKD